MWSAKFSPGIYLIDSRGKQMAHGDEPVQSEFEFFTRQGYKPPERTKVFKARTCSREAFSAVRDLAKRFSLRAS
jgi:hypothetical protein